MKSSHECTRVVTDGNGESNAVETQDFAALLLCLCDAGGIGGWRHFGLTSPWNGSGGKTLRVLKPLGSFGRVFVFEKKLERIPGLFAGGKELALAGIFGQVFGFFLFGQVALDHAIEGFVVALLIQVDGVLDNFIAD